METKIIPNLLIRTSEGLVLFDSTSLDFYEIEEEIPRSVSPTAFRIALTEKCNLCCAECFVTKNLKSHREMSLETLDDVLEQTFKHARSQTTTYRFFGGEPMLKLDLIEYAVQKISQAFQQDIIGPAIYEITTNATLLPATALELFKQNCFHVGVSVDGPKTAHDQLRPFGNGKGTYDTVRENYLKMHDAGIKTHVLITPNPAYMGRLVEFTEEILDDFPMETITINTPFHYDTLAWNLDGKDYAEKLIEIWRIAKKRNISVECAVTPVMAAISNRMWRMTPCSIVGESFMASVSPDGGFSYCAQKWDQKFDLSKRPDNYRSEACQRCYAIGYCGGVCPAFKALSGRELDQNKCNFMHAILPLIIDNLDVFEQMEVDS